MSRLARKLKRMPRSRRLKRQRLKKLRLKHRSKRLKLKSRSKSLRLRNKSQLSQLRKFLMRRSSRWLERFRAILSLVNTQAKSMSNSRTKNTQWEL